MLSTVGYRQPTIKPDDLVRTLEARTAIVVEIRPAGFRLIEDAVTGQRSIRHWSELYLVRSATPKRWRERTL